MGVRSLTLVVPGAHAMCEGGALVLAEALERIVHIGAHALRRGIQTLVMGFWGLLLLEIMYLVHFSTIPHLATGDGRIYALVL